MKLNIAERFAKNVKIYDWIVAQGYEIGSDDFTIDAPELLGLLSAFERDFLALAGSK